MSKNLSRYLDSYESITFLGDFNLTPEDKNLQHFADTFSLPHLINKPTYFKGSPNCIDLIITNRKSYFKNTCVVVTGISDFHKLTAVSLKSQVLKAPPKIKTYRNYQTKAFRKAIMTRSRLKSAYLKTRKSKNWEN